MSDKQGNTEAPVQVRVLYFEGCPNHPPTVQRLHAVAERLGVDVDLKEVEVKPDDDMHRLGFRGSTTVQINGVDLDPAERGRDNCGFSCRMYGGAGLPDEAMIEAALTTPPTSGRSHERSPISGEDDPHQQGSNDCCSTCGAGAMKATIPGSGRSGFGSSVAAFGSAVLASACCWLPLLLVGLGLSLSLGGLVDALHTVRPYLLIVAGVCFAVGFYMVYFKAASRRRTP